MKSWSYSIALLLEYLLTCQLWRTFPDRTAYLVVGGVALIVMSGGLWKAARRGYFADRSDLVLHGLVIFDIALECVSYELFHAASLCIFCAPADASTFHSGFTFCWCATILGVLVGGYHAWALRQVRAPLQAAPDSPGPHAS